MPIVFMHLIKRAVIATHGVFIYVDHYHWPLLIDKAGSVIASSVDQTYYCILYCMVLYMWRSSSIA